MQTVKEVLISRDGLTCDEADDLINEAREEIADIIDEGGTLDQLEQVISDYFSLEPDYLIELLP